MPRTEPFDNYSDEYDEWFETHRDLYEAELETIRRLLPPGGAEGMEVGVGSGKFAAPLEIGIGVEPSEKMAVKARKLGIEVYSAVAEELPFPDGRFDFVLIVTTICFVDDVLVSFREALRVLKPGGCIIVGFVDKEGELGRQYAARKDRSRFYRQATFFSAREVLEYLNASGFTVEQVTQALIPGQPPGMMLDGFGKGAFVAIKGIKEQAG